MKRRILAMVLACVMVFSLLPVMGFATTEEDPCEGKKHTLNTCPDAIKGETVAPICNGWGYTVYQCPDCGDYFADDFVKGAKEHETVVLEPEVPATCTKPGKTAKVKCTVCDTVMGGEEIKALGHKWSEPVVTGDCSTGYTATYTCACGETKTEETNGPGHKYGDMPVIKKEPTYTETGIGVYTCELCGYEKEVVILCQHECEMEKVAEVPATCTEPGVKAHEKCKLCGKLELNGAMVTEEKLVIKALGHDFKNGTVLEFVDSTCTEAGHETRKCARCDAKQTTDVKLKEHNYAVKEYVAPTCTTYGYEILTCLDCGILEVRNKFDPLGHIDTYEKAVEAELEIIEDAATCAEGGSYTWICRCNKVFKQEIKKLGCDLKTVTVAAVCARYGYTFTYCARENCDCDNCGTKKKDAHPISEGLVEFYEVDGVEYDVRVDGKAVNLKSITVDVKGGYDPNNHTPDNTTYTVINEPTCTEDGDCAYFCLYCSHYVTEAIPALGHKIDPKGAWVTVKQEQSCTTDEILIIGCSRCNKYSEELRTENTATGHKLDKGTVFAPTCTDEGYTRYDCLKCDHFEITDVVAPIAYQTEWTMEEAETAHKSLVFVRDYREGSCTILGLKLYYCADCGKNIFVIVEGTGEGHVKAEGLVTDCVTGYDCIYCGEHVSEEHEWDSEIPCEAKCTKCGTSQYRFPHMKIQCTDHAEQSCTQFGYIHIQCPDCDYEYIRDYAAALGHNMIVDETVSYDATCTEEGFKATYCERCDVTHEEIIPAKGHKNKAGETFYDDCCDTTEDRYCVVCELEIGKAHNGAYVERYEATCLDYGYIITVCEKCGFEGVEYINDGKLGDHTWVLVPEKCIPATHTEKGLNVYECSVCGDTKEESVKRLNGVGYEVTVDNAVVPGKGLSDSSLVAVTVNLSAYKVKVWGFTFDLFYDEDVMEFVGAEFVSDKFVTMPMAHDNGGYVSVVANTANDDDKQPTTYTINGDHDVVVLYFRVNCGHSDVDSSVSIGNIQTLALEGKEVKSVGYSADFHIDMLLDVNGDNDFNLVDAQYVYNMLIGASDKTYDVVADVDKDGVITLADFEAIYKFLIGALKYKELLALGVEK